jgi:hypothetical protein
MANTPGLVIPLPDGTSVDLGQVLSQLPSPLPPGGITLPNHNGGLYSADDLEKRDEASFARGRQSMLGWCFIAACGGALAGYALKR